MGEPHPKPPEAAELPRGRFIKGDPRINAGGMPRAIKEARDLLTESLPRAMAALVGLLTEADPKVRFMAAKEICDRTMGKPRERIEVSHVEQELEVLKALPEPEFRAQLLALVNQTQTEKEPA